VGNFKEVPDAGVYQDRNLSAVAEAEKAFEALHARSHRALQGGSIVVPPSVNDRGGVSHDHARPMGRWTWTE
jgi:hypothetical protein